MVKVAVWDTDENYLRNASSDDSKDKEKNDKEKKDSN